MRIRPVALIITLTLGLLMAPLAAEAQQAGKARRIGWLGLAAPTPQVERVLDALREGLRELGWVEGQNLVIEYRWAYGRAERFSDLAAELVGQNVELIVANCGPQIPAIRKVSTPIPIVVSACGDLIGGGFVASLSRPGGNITGLGMLTLELSAKRVQLLKETYPSLSRLAVLVYAPYRTAGYLTPMFSQMQAASQALGLTFLQPVEVQDARDFERALGSIARERADGLIVPADPFTFHHRTQIMDFAAKRRLPTMFEVREYVDAGGLMSYGPSVPAMFRRAATFVDKILKGAKPAELPVEQPTKFELVINRKTAKALGLTVPQELLLRADEVIE